MYEGPDGLIYGSRAHYEKATEYWGLIDPLIAKIRAYSADETATEAREASESHPDQLRFDFR